MRNSNFQHLIRVVAGVYVAYLGYKILRDGIVGGGMEEKYRILGIVFSILFIVVGAGLAVLALRNLNRAREMERERQEEEMEAAASDTKESPEAGKTSSVPADAPAEKSLFDKARISTEDAEEDTKEQTCQK
ncbi:MAG: hypothetical protein IKE31_11800 [Eubacterium sp.]|nr:hypothetical protein [Eubacterium sp.]